MALPTGTLTLMFTDIEGSTRLLAALGERYGDALDDHRRILRSAVAAAGGHEVDTQGDAFFLAFTEAHAALGAAVEVQRRLARHPWPEGAALRVRIGLHTGAPAPSAEGYVGIDLHRGARICAAGHGGQVVFSKTTCEALDRAIAEGVALRPLGAHRLKDIDEPLTLFDLEIAGLEDRFPALRSIGSRPTNLPSELPELIGRQAERAAAATLVRQARLVTLTGPGGSGKTTLALRVAADLLADQPDGAFSVLLAPVGGPDLVGAAIAGALGLREQAGRSYAEVVGDYLSGRQMLVVLDNFEHVLDAAPMIGELLAGAPGLRVLVTSRVVLRLDGESELAVSPLGMAPAVELFVRRAQSAKPGFVLEDATRPAVSEICARLDGLPLAIELAAARVRLMAPQAMLARLERPLELAAGGSRHAPTRQQALRATIDWSHDLLDDRAKRVFARLGVFAGPFTVEAAEEICDADLDDLAGLLDHSLLRAQEEGPSAGRLGMLETIRAYAADRLEASGELEEIRERHAAWCAALGRAGAPQLLSGAHEELLPRFDAEQDDLRAALDWLIASAQGDAALRMAGDLAVFWDTRGQYGEGRARLEQALEAAPEPDREDLARAHFGLGRLALMQGDGARAQPLLMEAVELHRALGDSRGTMLSLSHLGAARGLQPGGREDALRLNEESLAVARASGDPYTLAAALNNLAAQLGDDEKERARALLEESVRVGRDLGGKRILAIALVGSGELAVSEGRAADASPLLEEALALAIGLDFEMVIVAARLNLARLAFGEGDLERAESLLADGLERSDRMGDPVGRAGSLFGLARVASARRDTATASRLRESAERVIAEAEMVLSAFDRWEP